MAGSAPMEIRRDFTGEAHYASRNHNDLRHTHVQPDANRAVVDWSLTLRQVRKENPPDRRSSSLPNLHDAGERRFRAGDWEGHEEGPYHPAKTTVEKYQNFANTAHMLQGLTRVSSGTSDSINWQLNLRDGYHQQPDFKWRRYFTRSQASFDMTKENCSLLNESYQKSHVTPQDRRPDRNSGAVPCANLRADPLSFRRWPGCEGTDVGAWRHLIEDRQRGHKSKRQLAHETTLREEPGDQSGARVCDNRSSGCIVEMLGKKRWVGARSHDALAARPPIGDPRLHYLSTHKIIPEEDEENRVKRMNKQPRRDANIPESHPAARARLPVQERRTKQRRPSED